MYELEDYLTNAGRAPFKDWLASLADRQAKARVLVRLQRMAAGHFGDCKPLRGGGCG
jgi:putative addiction module killer protein